jgi:hypothetical protein
VTAAVGLIVPVPQLGREAQLRLLAQRAQDDGLELVALTQDVRMAVRMIIDGRARVVLALHGDVLAQLLADVGGELVRVVPGGPEPGDRAGDGNRRPRRISRVDRSARRVGS